MKKFLFVLGVFVLGAFTWAMYGNWAKSKANEIKNRAKSEVSEQVGNVGDGLTRTSEKIKKQID